MTAKRFVFCFPVDTDPGSPSRRDPGGVSFSRRDDGSRRDAVYFQAVFPLLILLTRVFSMSRFVRPLILCLAALILWPATKADAQRGEFIEGLFRTIAEAQLERERAKQAERRRQEAEKKAVESAARDPYEVQLPSGFGRGGNGSGRASDRNSPQTQRPPVGLNPNLLPPNQTSSRRSINVRSREAAEFVGTLVKFNTGLDSLVQDLRVQSSRQLGLRTLLPQAYSVAAEGQALLGQCDGLASLGPIVAPYQQLDARWRQLSFELRSAGPISEACGGQIRQCDQLCSAMARQLGIQPQLDRRALRDLMIQAATYMQVLLDDMESVPIPAGQARQLSHDCRLLRQRLLGEADHVDQASYEDVVSRFTDFVRRWSEFSQLVYSLDHPGLNCRLDRIGQCGDQTYALLWMPPPTSGAQVPLIAQRLMRGFEVVQDQLTLRAMASLRREDQLRVMESSRDLYDAARQLETASQRGAPRREQQALLSDILVRWTPLRDTLVRIESMNPGSLAEIDRSCERLRDSLGVTEDLVTHINIQSILQAAAALEGASEYLDADLQRYARYLQPDSYRRTLLDGSREFHHHARQLHDLLSHPAAGHNSSSMKKLQREAEQMLDGWEVLSRELAHLHRHGLSTSRAERITRSQQELIPLVAQIAAALLQR